VFFAIIAALLVALGLYGILAREVTTRTREIGIRMAVGARESSVLWMIVRETLLCIAIGVAAGVAVLVLIRPHMEPLLVNIRAMEPFALAAALLVLTIFSLVASLILRGARLV
jgi:ABC-type antimicrobial peptide transport system permease subunit